MKDEINEFLAVEVMGWSRQQKLGVDGYWTDSEFGPTTYFRGSVNAFTPSTNIAQAIEAWEKLNTNCDFFLRVSCVNAWSVQIRQIDTDHEISNGGGSKPNASGFAAALALAVARAAGWQG